jgi:acyl dehydratase
MLVSWLGQLTWVYITLGLFAPFIQLTMNSQPASIDAEFAKIDWHALIVHAV